MGEGKPNVPGSEGHRRKGAADRKKSTDTGKHKSGKVKQGTGKKDPKKP